MRVSHKSALFAATILGGFALAAPALAEDTANDESGAASSPSDIVVTARRIEERLQDVPISITVFNQEQLADRNINNTNDLAAFTPSLTSNTRYGPNNATYSIRGFYQELRTTASVATYFADVVAPRQPGSFSGSGDGAGIFQYWDLQNVQVLKGPQGTLFGRNTTGGAVLLVPQKPTGRLEGYVEGQIGSYDLRRVQAVINAPFGDNVRFRAGVDYNKRDGYLKNISGIGPNRFGDVNYISARASLVIDLTPDLENYTVAAYAESDTVGTLSHINQCATATRPLGLGQLGCAAVARQGQDRYVVENSLADPEQKSRYWSVINSTTWTVSDELTVKNIVSYAESRDRTRVDSYGTAFRLGATFQGAGGAIFPVPPAYQGATVPYAHLYAIPGGYTGNQSTFTEEFRLQGTSFDSALNWQAGVYYESSKPIGFTGTSGQSNFLTCTDAQALQCTDIVGRFNGAEGAFGNVQYAVAKTEYTNVGVYAQGTFKFNEWLSTTAGFRYTWDKTESETLKYTIRFPAPNDPRVFCVTPGLGAGNPSFNPTAPVYSPSIPVSQIGTACHENISQKSKAPTWTIGLEAKPMDDVLIYGKYSRGYRQGSTSPFSPSAASAIGFAKYGPEHVDVYEVGAKASWRGAMPGFFNIAGFYNKFKDQQVLAALLIPGQAANVAILNAGKTRIYGFEAEAGISPLPMLHLNANYAYLNSKLQSQILPYGDLPCTPTPFVCDFIPSSTVGRPLPLTPKHKYTLSARLELPEDPIGNLDVGMVWTWQSETAFTYANFPNGVFPSYGLLSANFNWKKMFGTPVDLSVFGTNLLNKAYIQKVDNQPSGGFVGRLYGEPSMYGIRLRYSF